MANVVVDSFSVSTNAFSSSLARRGISGTSASLAYPPMTPPGAPPATPPATPPTTPPTTPCRAHRLQACGLEADGDDDGNGGGGGSGTFAAIVSVFCDGGWSLAISSRHAARQSAVKAIEAMMTVR